MKLTGKVALVTNVSEFMGPAITEEFAREGATLALHDRDERAAKRIGAIATAVGRDTLILTGDLTRSAEADREVARDGIQVNAIAQNYVENPTYFPPALTGDPEKLARMVKNIPAGRLARSEESARLAVYLASEDAYFFIGQVVPFAG